MFKLIIDSNLELLKRRYGSKFLILVSIDDF